MELDLQSLLGLHVHSCTHWLRPPTPHLGSYTRALLVWTGASVKTHLLDPGHSFVVVLDKDGGLLVLHVVPHALVGLDLRVPEEGHCGPTAQGPIRCRNGEKG